MATVNRPTPVESSQRSTLEFSDYPAELSAEYQGYDIVTVLEYGYLAGGDEVVVHQPR